MPAKTTATFWCSRNEKMQSSPLPENPIPAKKKKRFQLRRRQWCRHFTPIASSNRFAYRKNNSNTAAARFLFAAIATETNPEVDAEIGASVTTRHLFWPNQRRNAASLLPIWLRNSDFPAVGIAARPTGGAGGLSAVQPPRCLNP